MQLDFFSDPFRRCLPVKPRTHIIGGHESTDGLIWLRASKGGIEGRVGQYMEVSSIFLFDEQHRLTQRMRIAMRRRFFPNRAA